MGDCADVPLGGGAVADLRWIARGDFLDDAAHGRMDCIDHANTTTRMLELLQERRLRCATIVVLEVARRRSWSSCSTSVQ
jgi:hypothetical protein